MAKLDEMTRQRADAHRKLLALDSRVFKAFLGMEQATYADGALTRKEKELIAIGIAVVINCESCMQWHIEQAAKAGAKLREVLEAIEVGIEMGGGPGTAHARFALDVMAAVFRNRFSRRLPHRPFRPGRRPPLPKASPQPTIVTRITISKHGPGWPCPRSRCPNTVRHGRSGIDAKFPGHRTIYK